MIGFAYSSIAVGFRAISMSFLSFLSQETYPGGFLRQEVIFSRSYLRKCFKNAIKSEPFGVRGLYFQDFHISDTYHW